VCWFLFGAPNTKQEPAVVLSTQGRTVHSQGPDVRGLTQGLGFLPDGQTVRALGPDGPRVRRGWQRSPATPGYRSRQGPRRGGEILGDV
jgi:hypothetical protein